MLHPDVWLDVMKKMHLDNVDKLVEIDGLGWLDEHVEFHPDFHSWSGAAMWAVKRDRDDLDVVIDDLDVLVQYGAYKMFGKGLVHSCRFSYEFEDEQRSIIWESFKRHFTPKHSWFSPYYIGIDLFEILDWAFEIVKPSELLSTLSIKSLDTQEAVMYIVKKIGQTPCGTTMLWIDPIIIPDIISMDPDGWDPLRRAQNLCYSFYTSEKEEYIVRVVRAYLNIDVDFEHPGANFMTELDRSPFDLHFKQHLRQIIKGNDP